MPPADMLTNLPDLTIAQAESWIVVALAEAKALRLYDDQLHPTGVDPVALRVAYRLKDAWLQWADGAAVLCERVRPLRQAGGHVDGAHDLDVALARARRDLVARGETTTSSIAEIRRDLPAAPAAAGAAAGAAGTDPQAPDPSFGEDLLDELDRLSADPSPLRPRIQG